MKEVLGGVEGMNGEGGYSLWGRMKKMEEDMVGIEIEEEG